MVCIFIVTCVLYNLDFIMNNLKYLWSLSLHKISNNELE